MDGILFLLLLRVNQPWWRWGALTVELNSFGQFQDGQIVLERPGVELFVHRFRHDVDLLRMGSVEVVWSVVLSQPHGDPWRFQIMI